MSNDEPDFEIPENLDASQNEHLVSALQVVVNAVGPDHPDWSQVLVAHASDGEDQQVGIWVATNAGPGLHSHPLAMTDVSEYMRLSAGFADTSRSAAERGWNVVFSRLLPNGAGESKTYQIDDVPAGALGEAGFMSAHFPVRNPAAQANTHTWAVFGDNVPSIGDWVQRLVDQIATYMNGLDQEWVRSAMVFAVTPTEVENNYNVHTHIYAVRGDENSGEMFEVEVPPVDITPLLGQPSDLYILRLMPDANDPSSTQATFTGRTSVEGQDPLADIHDQAKVSEWIWEPAP